MPVSRINHIAPVSNDSITMKMVRQMRNFMNNWEVSGGSFSFDGQKARLRVDQPRTKPDILFLEHPWKLYQEPEDIPGRRISMLPGVLVRTAAASLYPLNTLVNKTPANAPDDATTLYWLKVSVSKSAYQSYFEVWTVDSWAVETGSALPADTLDIPNDTAGDLHFQIGIVTAADGEIVDIQQDLAAPVTIVFPLGVIIDEFECPAEEEEEE
jgi:hypothetical protein